MKYFLIIFSLLSLQIFANPYIKDLEKIKKSPITDGYIDEELGTELQREYSDNLPFKLNDFSIFAELKGFINYSGDIKDFINKALSFSNMKNLKYLDPTSNRYTMMVKEAYSVKEDSYEPISDRKYDEYVKNNKFYIIEHDAKVGKIILEGNISFLNENEFTITFTNIVPIKFIVNLVDENNYNIFYHFIKEKDGYFVYNAIKVKSANKLLVWLIKKPEDFENRLIAFYNWVVEQVK